MEWQGRLADVLVEAVHPDARVIGVRPLFGGACQENFRVEAELGDGPETLVLRSDANLSLPGSLTREREAEVIDAAVRAGVRTPAVRCRAHGLLREGATAYLMDFVEGVAIGAKVTRAPALAAAREVLPGQLAAALAKIHSVTPQSEPDLHPDNPQSAPDGDAPEAALRFVRLTVDALPEPYPAMELIYRWLQDNRPPEEPTVLVHGDYRTGNFLVGPDGLRAVLDWEFAHWGYASCDIAWHCLRDWRFGCLDRPAGGLATREAFAAAYADAGGRPVDPAAVRWWEVLGNLRWAAGAVFQAFRVLGGHEQDLELLAIGRRAAEMEYEALRLIGAVGEA